MHDVDSLAVEEFWALVRFNEQGLIPAIVQDDRSGAVLMHAWMNESALALTLERRQAVFWSRSRAEIWHKGATSGHYLDVTALLVDCDGDTLLLRVHPQGPACHTGQVSCFFRSLDPSEGGLP